MTCFQYKTYSFTGTQKKKKNVFAVAEILLTKVTFFSSQSFKLFILNCNIFRREFSTDVSLRLCFVLGFEFELQGLIDRRDKTESGSSACLIYINLSTILSKYGQFKFNSSFVVIKNMHHADDLSVCYSLYNV